MKKIYSNPQMNVFKIATQQQLLAFSDQTTKVKFDSTQQSSTMDARGGWFDEDEE